MLFSPWGGGGKKKKKKNTAKLLEGAHITMRDYEKSEKHLNSSAQFQRATSQSTFGRDITAKRRLVLRSPRYLSVFFSDSTAATSRPLFCCQAWKRRCCLLPDLFLWLGIDVFMGRSAVSSHEAEPHIGFSANRLQVRSPSCKEKRKLTLGGEKETADR